MTPHNSAKIGDIAKVVIMPGDPLRAKYIADNFLTDVKIVSNVRGIACYTGNYKGKQLSVMAHGMGMPSMGIYSYELFHFYDVDAIIRIGTCGGFGENINLFDLVLSTESYTEGSYALTFDNEHCNLASGDVELNNIIRNTANELDINLVEGTTLCDDMFFPYLPDQTKIFERMPKEINKPIANEMEAFSLFHNAKREGKKAACLLTVAGLVRKPDTVLSTEDREKSLNSMITLALEAAIKI